MPELRTLLLTPRVIILVTELSSRTASNKSSRSVINHRISTLTTDLIEAVPVCLIDIDSACGNNKM